VKEEFEEYEYGGKVYVWHRDKVRKAIFIKKEESSIYSYVVFPIGNLERIERRYIKKKYEKVVMERILYFQEEQQKVLKELERDRDLHISKHKFFECHCNKPYCMFCDGGLGYCTVCNGFEGTLTTECCGRKLTEIEEDKIYKEGTLDFKEGQWIEIQKDI
jgi:hypothetical protein